MADTFFNRSVEEVLREQESSSGGLSNAQAADRLKKYGPNALVEGKKKSVLQVFLEQFKDLLVVILIVAAIISMLSGQGESTIVIFAVLILNAILGTVQYFKAEKSLESLKAMSSPTAKVLRGGAKVEVPSKEVVPGDIVFLEAGDLVVADGRVIENFSLKVNESSLTGESEGVEKTEEVIPGEKVALGDQKNMVFSGSLVTYGRATVVVTGTGMHTEIGKIASLMNQTQQRKTPLQQSLDDFSKKLAVIILAICVVVFGLSLYREMPILDSLMFAVALAVAAIPEALSSIVTIVLAMGTQKMAKENAIIKDLKAVESLGSVSVICSDKTGTLTQNKMCVQKIYADGQLLDGKDLQLPNDPQRLLLKIAILASDATSVDGADIGVAMGITGTEVSKDAASMILEDDNFATIVKAVLNGRNVYENIKNAIQFLLSGNMAAILCVLFASIVGLPMPFAPVHLLFINLLTDSLPAIAIGMEPARKDLLDRKPRDPKEPILNRSLLGKIFGQGLLIGIATMAAFYIGYGSTQNAALAMTMAFATLTLARLFHGFNCRGEKSIFRLGLGSNKYSLMAFAAGIVLLAAVLLLPFLETLFQVAPLTLANVGMIVLLAILPTVCIQIFKVIRDLVKKG